MTVAIFKVSNQNGRFTLLTVLVLFIIQLFVLQEYLIFSTPIYQSNPEIRPVFIRTILIDTDIFLQDSKTNGSNIEFLKKSLEEYRVRERKIYKVSLTRDEQLKLENSAAVNEMKSFVSNFLHQRRLSSKDLELLGKGPSAFLSGFKNPCWYTPHHQLRCFPFFFLIGAAKAGTTDVYKMLQIHPDFRSYIKEPHWFTKKRFEKSSCNFDWYARMIAMPLSHWSLFSTRLQEKMITLARNVIIGDCSATTMWENFRWPFLEGNSLPLEPTLTTADYIYHLNKKTKIVAILRNPISRLYSDYIYFDGTRMKGPRDFHNDVILTVKYFNSCFEQYSIRSCVYNAHLKAKIESTTMVRLWGGIYFIHLREWYRVFPSEQILILRLEDYTMQRTETVKRLYDFLTLGNITEKTTDTEFIKAANSSIISNSNNRQIYKNNAMFEETRYILYTFYKPFNRALARMLNDPKFDYGPC